jgi:hypothetical protein
VRNVVRHDHCTIDDNAEIIAPIDNGPMGILTKCIRIRANSNEEDSQRDQCASK